MSRLLLEPGYFRWIFVWVPIIVCLSASQAVSAIAAPLTGVSNKIADVSNPPDDDQPGANLQPGDTRNGVEFEHITIDHGLSQNSVLSILQDSRGFMWFGTWDGLNKYDGYKFTVYLNDPDDPFSLSDNAVFSILEDSSGVLWIGTGNGGLNRFDRDSERFSHYYHDLTDSFSLSSDIIISLYEDHAGSLWIGTSGGGLNRFDPLTERFISYQNDPLDPDSLSNNTVNVIFEDSQGILWVGTGGGGLNRFVPGSSLGTDLIQSPFGRGVPEDVIIWVPDSFVNYKYNLDIPYTLSSNDVYSIFEDNSGTIWIGAGDGSLNKFDRETQRFTRFLLDPGDLIEPRVNPIRSIAEDPSGKLWIGIEHGGLFQFDPKTGRYTHFSSDPRNPDGLSSNNIHSTYSDRSGVLWVGTNGGGINKYYQFQKKFAYYQNDPTNPNSLSENEVLSIFLDRSGMLWIGTNGDGIKRFGRKSEQFTQYINDPDDPNSLSGDIVQSIYEDRSGVLWIGTAGGGLNRFERETGGFIHYQHDPFNPYSLSDNNVLQIYEDRAGLLWIGTYGGGLNRLDQNNGKFIHYKHDPKDPTSLSSNSVRVIYEDGSGKLWIGTNNGLNEYQLETERFIQYFHDPVDPYSLGDNYILSILEDRSGMLWIGTNGGGLDGFDREKKIFSHYRMKDGLLDQVIYGILEDGQGNLWLSTSKGLSSFSPLFATFKNYDAGDGLPDSGFTVNAFHKGRSGEMFFGGLDGLITFYPQNIQDDPNVPPVVLTQLTQGGEPIELDKSIENVDEVTIKWPNNYFEFEFAALSYIEPQDNQYAYKLDGYDETWNAIGTKRTGRYTNLPEGAYTLQVKGSNRDGVWNEDAVSLNVTVLPPFWAADWFRAAVGLMLIVGIIGGYRYRISRVHAHNRELETMVHQRTYEVERRRRVADGLGEIMDLLNSNKSLELGLDLIVSRASQLTGANCAVVFRRECDDPVEVLAMHPLSFVDETIGVEQIGALFEWLLPQIRGEQPLIVPRLESDPISGIDRSRLYVGEGGAAMCVPIYVNEEIYGGLGLVYTQERMFSNEDVEIVTILTDQAALAIGNALLRERVEVMAITTERNRLARDLHDAVTQTLFSAGLIAEAERNWTGPCLCSARDSPVHLLISHI